MHNEYLHTLGKEGLFFTMMKETLHRFVVRLSSQKEGKSVLAYETHGLLYHHPEYS